MRFMMIVLPKDYADAEPGTMPEGDRVVEMMKYNQDLQDAGVLRALHGLHPPSMGSRVSFVDGEPTVTDGPFAEAKEVVGGYWIIEVGSKQEAVDWARRCPMVDEMIEIRQLQEMEEFDEEVQAMAAGLQSEE